MGAEPAQKIQPAKDLPPDPTDVDPNAPEFGCCVPVGKQWVKVVNQEVGRVLRPIFCGKEAAFVPIVTFGGRPVVTKRNEEGKVVKYRSGAPRFAPVRFQGVCAEHKRAIDKDPRVLLSPGIVRSQEKDLVQCGFPPPEAKHTSLRFEKFVAPEPEVESITLDALVARADGEEIPDGPDEEEIV